MITDDRRIELKDRHLPVFMKYLLVVGALTMISTVDMMFREKKYFEFVLTSILIIFCMIGILIMRLIESREPREPTKQKGDIKQWKNIKIFLEYVHSASTAKDTWEYNYSGQRWQLINITAKEIRS